MRALVLLLASLVALPASAQPTSLPEGLDYPDRAMALRPTGLALHRFGWSTMIFHDAAGPMDVAHQFANEQEGRVPIDSLLLEVAAGATLHWIRLPTGSLDPAVFPRRDDLVVLVAHNVQLGAAFRDAPAPGWRYELGGALTVPSWTVTTIDADDPPPPGSVPSPFPESPIRNLLAARATGWNAHRHRRDTLSIVAHARLELDPIPELVIGVEADVPFTVLFETESVDVRPQVALEIAGRFEEVSLAGLRAELTSYPDVNVLLEPFVRLTYALGSGAAFVRVGLRLPLGPGYPFATEAPLGYVGATLEAGALL